MVKTIPYKNGRLEIPFGGYQLVDLGIQLGHDQCLSEYGELSTAIDAKTTAYSRWFSIISRIQEAAQVSSGEGLKTRLRFLSCELASAGVNYRNALIQFQVAQKKWLRGRLPVSNIESVIDGVVYVTSTYQTEIGEILKGRAGAERLRTLHEGDDRPEFKPFDLGLNRGGAPEKGDLGALYRVAEPLYRQYGNKWKALAVAVWANVESSTARDDDQAAVFEMWQAMILKQRVEQLRYLFNAKKW